MFKSLRIGHLDSESLFFELRKAERKGDQRLCLQICQILIDKGEWQPVWDLAQKWLESAEQYLDPLLAGYAAKLFRGIFVIHEERGRCTGIAAQWCPLHGECQCPDREEDLNDPKCPLHRPGSNHPSDPGAYYRRALKVWLRK